MKTGRYCFSHYYILLICVFVIQALEVNVKGIFLEFLLVKQIVILVNILILDRGYIGALSGRCPWNAQEFRWLAHIFIQLVEAG